jgi:inhibitor of cysteine peptidase
LYKEDVIVMFYLKAGYSFFRVALCSCAVFCVLFFGWSGSGYGGTTPSFTWTIDAVYPVQEESIAASEAELTRNTMFRDVVTNLSTSGTGASLERFRSKNVDVYRIKSKSGMPLDDFRRQFHSEIAKKISFLSGPVRMSISGKAPSAGSLTVVVDSNPSTGYHWVADSSSGAEVVFKKTTFNRRSFKHGAVQSQQLIFTSSQVNAAQIDLVYARPWRKQDVENIQLKIETGDALPEVMDLSDPYAVSETVPNANQKSLAQTSSLKEETSLPSSYDWRTYGAVPDIRDQGSCGSCFAFGTVGIMESAMKISGWSMTDLSEQFLVSCNKDRWNCSNGGLTAHKYHYDTLGKSQTVIGAVLETDMPYTATNGSCKVAYKHPYILSNWSFVTTDEFSLATVDQIKTAIYNHGPITAGICAGNVFSNYTSGIYSTDETTTTCGGTSTNHQIILVGWNDNNGVDVDGYWILRNSWGTGWGESGYMKVKYGTSRVGEGTSYVTVESPSTFLYASFAGAGIWEWDGSWTQLTPGNPVSMVTSGTSLYASFAGNGIYKWDGSWTQLTPGNPVSMVTSGTNLFASFAGNGIYKWDGTWTQLTPGNPVSMVTSDTNLYASFAGNGIYKWDGSWTQLTPGNPESMVTSDTNLYASFAGNGIYKWDGTWTQLTPGNPVSMVTSDTNLYASFAGNGIYKWDGTWTQLTPGNPVSMMLGY